MNEITKLKKSEGHYGVLCVVALIISFVTGFVSIQMFANENYISSVCYRWLSSLAMLFTILFCIIVSGDRVVRKTLQNTHNVKKNNKKQS